MYDFSSRATVLICAVGLAALAATTAVAAASPSGASVGTSSGAGGPEPVPRGAYEVWTIDQTDSRINPADSRGYGGLLHIYAGGRLRADASTAPAETIDLGGAASQLCYAKTGAWPVRPHMLVFNGGDADLPGGNRYAVVAWVVSGHVLILDATSRQPIDCLRASPGAGGARQAHAVSSTPDQKWLLVANQNGKLLERISADWQNAEFEIQPEATLSLHEGTTPSGAPRQDAALRPDNAPICPRTTDDGRFTFVSLRGGGAFVVDHHATPMRIVAEYDKAHIGDNGCGQAQAGERMFINAGAGAPGDRFASAVHVFELSAIRPEGNAPNTPAPKLVYAREGEVDAHGVAVTRNGRYLLAGDRAQNDITVVDAITDQVVNRFSLMGAASSDPAPDLFDLSPDGSVVFTSLRGVAPLSGGHDAVGATPGIGVVRLTANGTDGQLVGVAPARRNDGKDPDTHAIRIRPLVP